MAAKKDIARFTIRFNIENPRHNEAMRILNKHGKGMASLIADALCMYVYYGASFNSSHKEPAGLDIASPMAKPAEVTQDDFRDILNASLDAFF